MQERPIGTVIAGYRVDEIVGRGGMGVVYRAMDILLERTVALKLIAPELAREPSFRARFTRELKFVASIDHPNVIPVLHAGEDEGDLFIAMRYVQGTDLRAMIVHDGALPAERATAIVTQVGSGLEAAHALGLVHRDVKPANVLIAERAGEDRVFLTDFGLSKHTTSAPGLTRTGQFVGTVDYVAPEQIRGDAVDERADVYALGCVLFHALTGQPPFPRDSEAAKLWAHMCDAPPSVRDVNRNVPASFDDVLRRALDKDPVARFQSARELLDATAAALRPAHDDTLPGGLIARPVSEVSPPAPSREPPPESVVPPPIPPVTDTRSVPQPPPTVGDARPPPSPPPPEGPPAVPPDPESARPKRRLLLALALAAVGLAVIGVTAVLLAGGGDDEGAGSEPATVPQATTLPSDLTWHPVAKLPFKRMYGASTTVDGKVWFFGGIRTSTASTTTKSYDPDSNDWTTGPGLPNALHHFAAVTYNGEAVVIGGFLPGAELTSGQSDRVWQLHDGYWKPLPSLHHKRAAAAASVVGGKIVVVGGQADGKLVPQTEVFDGKRWTDAEKIPTAREHLGAASDGRYVYAVGGRDMSADANSAALERYDPRSDSWTRLQDMPKPVGSVGVAYAGGRIVTVGGEGTTAASDAVYGYDIRNQQWSPLPNLPAPRHGAAVTALDDSLYAIGGAGVAGHAAPMDDVELLDLSGKGAAAVPEHLKWHAVASTPANVQYAAAVDADDRIWVFGGIGDDELATAHSWAYDRAINNWTEAGPKLPRPIDHAAAVTYKGAAVVIGGRLQAGGQPSGESDGVYALRGNDWTKLPALNHARWAAAAAVVGNRIVVVGGRAGGKLVPETEVFDGHRWKDAAPILTPRDHLGAASDGHYVYAVGGRRLDAANNVGALERYDPATNKWIKLKPMPKITGAVGVAYVAGRIVAVGGEGPNTVSDAVQAYDVRRHAWTRLPDLPEARHGVAVTVRGYSLFAIGGAGKAGHVDSTRDVNVLDFD